MKLPNVTVDLAGVYTFTMPNGSALKFTGLDIFNSEVLSDALMAHSDPNISRLQRELKVTGIVALVEALEAKCKLGAPSVKGSGSKKWHEMLKDTLFGIPNCELYLELETVLRAELAKSKASMDELRKVVADIIGADSATWPPHGNVPLAIAANIALMQEHIALMTEEIKSRREVTIALAQERNKVAFDLSTALKKCAMERDEALAELEAIKQKNQ